jgi:serine phosphatase RsbU (regulator of sigma subunit)
MSKPAESAPPQAALPSHPGRPGRSLRGKTVALLLATTGVVVLAAVLIGYYVADDIRQNLGTALARNQAQLTKQRILSAVGREMALSQRFAESTVLREWMADEQEPTKADRFFKEGEGFRRAFTDQSYFAALASSRHFYFADPEAAPRAAMRYTATPGNADDAWFFATLKKNQGYSLNVDFDKKLQVTNVWINIVVQDEQGQPLGIAGTGLNLSRFLANVLANREPGVVTMILDQNGTIVAHPDTSRMEYATAGKQNSEKTVFRLVERATDQEALRQALASAMADDGESTATLRLRLEGAPSLAAATYIPSLRWTVLTAVDMNTSKVLDARLATGLLFGTLLLLALLVGVYTAGLNRLVLRPLAQLTAAVRRIGAGHYDERLESPRQDEIGELTRAFDTMAQQVREHSDNLERLVAERTRELAEAHRKVTDSIRYASLIQNAILPDRTLDATLQGQYFALWRPRDVVGGDFYLYRHDDRGCLFGVVDCAGHGVPGACMTMIAHAALEVAASDTPLSDPAALLQRTDSAARAMLPDDERMRQIATSMDMGLAYVDLEQRQVTFSGARLGLFWSDGSDCQEVPGHRRGINDRKAGEYQNVQVPLAPGRSFYLVSDGLLDQAGGEQGFGFGAGRLAAWIREHAAQPLEAQKEALARTLQDYQGPHPQRDDITILAFRFDDRR